MKSIITYVNKYILRHKNHYCDPKSSYKQTIALSVFCVLLFLYHNLIPFSIRDFIFSGITFSLAIFFMIVPLKNIKDLKQTDILIFSKLRIFLALFVSAGFLVMGIDTNIGIYETARNIIYISNMIIIFLICIMLLIIYVKPAKKSKL